jgi:F-type H+-transporting ATPase subunit delta
MGSATTAALASVRAVLASSTATGVDLAAGKDILAAYCVLARSMPLRSAVADPMADTQSKAALVKRVFANREPFAVRLLVAVASQRWSTPRDVLVGTEDVGLRTVAMSAPALAVESGGILGELFSFDRTVATDTQLELALGSQLGTPERKLSLVDRLLAGKVSEQSLAIVRHLVHNPRGRRIGELLDYAANTVADQFGLGVATVVAAVPLTSSQRERLKNGLARLYGRAMTINQVVDASIVGGVRVRVADDVIDGSIFSRLTDLRLQLTG